MQGVNEDLYKAAGVNIEAGDSFSKAAAAVCAASFNNNRYVRVHDDSAGLFRGLRGYDIVGLPEGYVHTLFPDGIGTKVELITAAGTHHTAAWNMLAMCLDDGAVKGALPLVVSNVLDVVSLGEVGDATNNAFRDMMIGFGAAAKEGEVVILNGETAELGLCVGSENPNAVTKFNWAGMVTGVYYPDQIITGETIAPGMAIVALQEKGARSNWFSSIRMGFRIQYGNQWYDNPDAKASIEQAAVPATLYTPLLTTANDWYKSVRQPGIKIHGAAHITGGGIKGKLGEDILFRRGLSANLSDLWEVPDILVKVADWTGASDEAFYKGSGGGNGCLVILEEKDCDSFCNMATQFGIGAKRCGTITKEAIPQVTLRSGLSDNIVTYQAA